MPKILIIEDEKYTADTIALYLEQQGFECLKAYDGQEGISCLLRNEVDLIVLDWMLPGLSGIEVCQVVKSMRKVKIIMLSAKASVTDKVTGLEVGADDYLAKPFSLRELNARVRMLLRQTHVVDKKVHPSPAVQTLVQFGQGVLTLNKPQMTAKFNEVTLSLTPSEFKILYLMAERVGQVLTKEQIANELHDTEAMGDLHTITVHLSNLRTKLRELTSTPMIKTIYGVGYKLDGANRETGWA
ncbi:response regulator transcription factor [Alicyclobacillus tolerans]|uniref:response regulator transcription factor n=1 Tax=Alicyclobacillus tolerans TaxID=90970 RepID=UPI001F2FFA47|nr:response regulator transcription factor [Alicyclobacillus tolerans]MCF8567265.1 response regulator transcription factor [Alicyclobacillus tolerans]